MLLAVYGKHKNDKRYRGFNMNNCVFVDRKVHLTLYNPIHKEELQEEIDCMNEDNENYIFELRRVE